MVALANWLGALANWLGLGKICIFSWFVFMMYRILHQQFWSHLQTGFAKDQFHFWVVRVLFLTRRALLIDNDHSNTFIDESLGHHDCVCWALQWKAWADVQYVFPCYFCWLITFFNQSLSKHSFFFEKDFVGFCGRDQHVFEIYSGQMCF